jgi:hypothetical protein
MYIAITGAVLITSQCSAPGAFERGKLCGHFFRQLGLQRGDRRIVGERLLLQGNQLLLAVDGRLGQLDLRRGCATAVLYWSLPSTGVGTV